MSVRGLYKSHWDLKHTLATDNPHTWNQAEKEQ